MIVIEKDKHTRKEQPFFDAHKAYSKWFCEQEFNNSSNTFISLGDLYHTASPTPEEYDEMERHFNEMKMKEIILLGGNHDWSDVRKVHSILPHRNNPRVTIITEPCVRTIEGKTFAFLPFLKSKMRERYSSLSDEFINADFVCYHFDDETIAFGKKKTGIDLSYLKGKRIGGHIHISQKNYELGMPVNSCYTEKGQDNNLLLISDKEEFISVPKLIDYYEIEYGEEISETEAKFPIFDILNAPSRKQAQKFYKDYYLHNITVLNKKKESIQAVCERSSITEFFTDYMKDRGDLKDWAQERLRNIISKR